MKPQWPLELSAEKIAALCSDGCSFLLKAGGNSLLPLPIQFSGNQEGVYVCAESLVSG